MNQPTHERTHVWRARAIDAVIALSIAGISLCVLVGTSRDYAMVFDEAFTIDREITLAEWFTAVIDPPAGTTRSDLFSRGMLERYWRFSRREPDGHPPFYALIGLAGRSLSRHWVDPLTSYRFGSMALTAATLASIYGFLARRRGRLAGVTAALVLVLSPRTFAHAHYAHYDMPVTCLWLLAQMAFLNSLHSARWIVAFGILLGLAAGTKLTGWFAVAPALAWWLVHEGIPLCRRGLRHIRFDGRTRNSQPAVPIELSATRALAIGIPLAALTLYLIQPAWWRAPLWGVERFLTSNLTREASVPVTSLYFGTVYRFSLPWHNTLVLTAITTPVLVVSLGILGIGAAVARVRSAPGELIWLLSWSILLIVRALPSAPGHDMERLILPSIASLAVLAGLGAACLADWLEVRPLVFITPVVVALTFAECIQGIIQTYPYNLSYYNVAVGGLPGAERLGFDDTYYWETLGPELFDWLHRRSLQEQLELRFPLGLLNIIILRQWGMFPNDVKVVPLEETVRPYYVLQRNRGIYSPLDWWIDRNGHPVFTVERQGIDLLRVYSFEEWAQAAEVTRNEPGVLKSSQRPSWGFPG